MQLKYQLFNLFLSLNDFGQWICPDKMNNSA